MIEISSEEIKKLHKINSGSFGTVFQVDENTAYKIYHDEIKLEYDRVRPNPMLKENNRRIKRIINKNEKVLYTDFMTDTIYKDGKFCGAVVPFYEGVILLDKINSPFSEKIVLVNELVRNAIELNDNNVYPIDYKLNNIVSTKNGIKIIDLDDIMTKYTLFKNPFMKEQSVSMLFQTIISFMENKVRLAYNPIISNELEKVKFTVSGKFHEIYNYLYFLSIVNSIVLVDSVISEEEAQIIKNNKDKVIYLHSANSCDDNYFMNIILEYRKLGIQIYDFVHHDELDNYLVTNNVRVRKL